MDDNAVNTLRKADKFGKMLIDDFESLFLMSGLIFKIILPRRGSRGRALLTINQSDFAWICSKIHAAIHRGQAYTYAIMTCKYYSEDMYTTISDVIQSCHLCSSFNINRKDHSLKLQNLLDLNTISSFSCDLKGPLDLKTKDSQGNPKKYYILCIINPITGFSQFYYLPNPFKTTDEAARQGAFFGLFVENVVFRKKLVLN